MHKLDEKAGRMSLGVALDFADNPRPHHTLAAPADTNGELYEALSVLASAYLASLPSPESVAQQPTTEAVRDVLAERARQISAEGWTPEHDDTHANGEMAAAAACYAFAAARSPHEINNRVWPWSWDWWKPTDPRRNCVKACALLLAQIEQLDRAGKRS